MLAAGFVIGPDGRSIQSIASSSGAFITSKTIRASVSSPRDCREFCFKGSLEQVVAALSIVEEAVKHYKYLTEGSCCGLVVERIQKISGIDFVYHPPPRSAAPEAARLKNPGKKIHTVKNSGPADKAQTASGHGEHQKDCMSPRLFAPGDWTYKLIEYSNKFDPQLCTSCEDFDLRDGRVVEGTKQASYQSYGPTPVGMATKVDTTSQSTVFQWPATPEKIVHKRNYATVQSKRKACRNIDRQSSSTGPSLLSPKQVLVKDHINTSPLLVNGFSNEPGTKDLIRSIADEERIEVLKSVALSLGFKSLDLVLKH